MKAVWWTQSLPAAFFIVRCQMLLARGMVMVAGVMSAVQVWARPMDLRSPNLEASRMGKPRPPVYVPFQATNNVALGCVVTASTAPTLQDSVDCRTPHGDINCVVDGDKEHDDNRFNLPSGRQWVQLDLGTTLEVWAVQIWHAYDYSCVYHDVVVQLSNDPDFIDGVVTAFNNDHDNSAGLGMGMDKEYIETNEGRCVEVEGVPSRFIRIYSSGCTETPVNRYTEIEVYGRKPVDIPDNKEPRVLLRIMLPKPIFT